MLKLIAFAQAYLTQEDGATAIEYGLIAAGISLAIVASVFAFGDDLGDLFGAMEGTLEGADQNITEIGG
jgi:pilus assembly protein Flp/PilA